MGYEACLEFIPIVATDSSSSSSESPCRFESVLSLGERVTLGKDKSSTIRLGGCALASRKHCSLELIKKADGLPKLVVRDSSTNGCFLNRERVKGKRVISDGDELHVQIEQKSR